MGYSLGCYQNMIIVDKKEKRMINNEYTIKQYIIIMCVELCLYLQAK